MLGLIIPLLFATLLLIFVWFFGLFVKDSASIKRIGRYIDKEDQLVQEKTKQPKAKMDYRYGLGILSSGIKRAKFLDGYKKRVKSKLVTAHVPLKPEEFITIGIISLVVMAALFFLITFSILLALVGGVIGWFLPSIIVKSRRKKRLKELNDQLGDVITMISNSLKAGYSFFQTVELVSREMSGPAAEEFTILRKEVSLGVATELALENMVERAQSEDLEIVVTAILIQRQTGGNLAEILDNISETIRERVKVKKEVKTLTATGRMSGMVVSLLPVAMFLIINMINPQYMGVLFDGPIGIGIVVYAIISEFIGIMLVNKIVKIEV